MKRPGIPKPTSAIDIRRDVSVAQLAAIGAVHLEWNRVERGLDWALLRALDLPWSDWTDVVSRISGVAAKIEILKNAANAGVAHPHRAIITETLGGAASLKPYRDAIAHAVLFDASVPIGIAWQYQARITEILLTPDALNALCDRLAMVHLELGLVVHLFYYSHVVAGLCRTDQSGLDPERAASLLGEIPMKLSRLQAERRALPPLPEFPPEVVPQD
jgi:hypothetical protein